MLARQGVDRVQALFHLLKALGVGIEMIEKAVELANRFFYLDLRTGQQVGRFAQGTWLALEGAQAVEAAGQGGEHVAGVVLAALFYHQAAGAEQALGVGQGFVFLLQLHQFAFAESQIVEFFKLIAEQLVTGALLVTLVGEALQLVPGLLPALCGQLYLACQFLTARVFIEQATVGFGFQ
ncbi:hypothetical protein D9M68_569630 [compost metagenome]